MENYILLLSVLFVLSFGLTWVIKNYSEKRSILDIPNDRSSHSVAVPRGGGLAIVLTWYSGITVFFFLNIISRNLYYAMLSGAILAVISLIDDYRGLRPLYRLLAQSVSVVLALLFLGEFQPPFSQVQIPMVFVYPFVFIGMIWFINLYNFLDGIDGYASCEAIAITSAVFLFSGNMINLVLIACVLGFLVWNWPKAKIFMGDVGSTQLGFILVVLAIHFHNHYDFSILDWIMLSSPFWFDATLTLYRRWRNGERLSKAHRKHVYQRFVQAGYSHKRTVIFLLLVNLVIIILILIYREFKTLQIPIFIVALLSYYFITLQVDRMVPFNKQK